MNDKKIWDFFLEKLNNPIGVASLMGNLYVESKLDPMYVEGSYRRKLGMTSEEYTKAVDNGTLLLNSYMTVLVMGLFSGRITLARKDYTFIALKMAFLSACWMLNWNIYGKSFKAIKPCFKLF